MGLDAEDLKEIINDFIVEARESLEQMDQDLVALEGSPENRDLMNRIFRHMHTIKGTANFLNSMPLFAEMASVAHASEDVMGALRSDKILLNSDIMDAILQAMDAIKKLFADVEAGKEEARSFQSLVVHLRSFLETTSSKTEQADLKVHGKDIKLAEKTGDVSLETKVEDSIKIKSEDASLKPKIEDTSLKTKTDANLGIVVENANLKLKAEDTSLKTRAEDANLKFKTEDTNAKPKVEDSSIKPKLEEKENNWNKILDKLLSELTLSPDINSNDRKEILQDFLAEFREIVEKLDQIFIKIEKNPQDKSLIESAFRYLHTLKGNTSFLGFNNISKLTHAAEDVMRQVQRDQLDLSSDVIDVLLEVIDILKKFFQKLEGGIKQDIAPEAILEKLKNLYSFSESMIVKENKIQPETNHLLSNAITKTRKMPIMTEQTIRVETGRLDKLMNLIGELVLGRNRLLQLMKELQENLQDDKICHELAASVDFIDFVTSDLQMAVLKTRMQPISKIFNRFTRTVRDLARDLGKDVRLVIQGAETELDKSVIDELGDPLTHLLRNAVDHGIETPEKRKSLGKSPAGTVTLSAYHEGNRIIIEIQDDGKGIDPQVIKEKAISQGLLGTIESQRIPDKEILEFIFMPGFSTASQVTSVSGRGVGMDVVKNSIEKLNGSVEIKSSIGQGSTFSISLPLTLAIIQVLHVEVETEIFAIPLTSVIETMRIYLHQIQTISGKEVIRFRDTIVPLVRLKKLLELGSMESKIDKVYIVITGTSDKKIGLIVDRIVGQEDVVVKSLGKLLQNTPGISGACIGGDGKVTLILDIAGILRLLPHNIGALVSQVRDTKPGIVHSVKTKNPCILLVEDSRSERKKTRLVIESKGYKVVEAEDGKEALGKLMDHQIDLVITDIEMPELDGYELTSKIREHRKFSSLPVIAVSSHKEMIDRIKGMESGIDTYLPKPINEKELFSAIKGLLP